MAAAQAAWLVVAAACPESHRAGRRLGRRLEEGDLAAGKSIAAEHGAWIVFEDEAGQSMTPPPARTWGRRGLHAGRAGARPRFRASVDGGHDLLQGW